MRSWLNLAVRLGGICGCDGIQSNSAVGVLQDSTWFISSTRFGYLILIDECGGCGLLVLVPPVGFFLLLELLWPVAGVVQSAWVDVVVPRLGGHSYL